MPIRTDPVLPEEDWQLRLEAPEDGSGVGTLTLDYPEKLNMWSWEATRQLKADPQTAGIGIVAFVSHVQAQLKQQALEIGCDTVVARSVFAQNLPAILDKYLTPSQSREAD